VFTNAKKRLYYVQHLENNQETIMNKITIKTRLHDGIYASSGGGKTITHYVYNVGPKNLLKAVKDLREHRASMRRSFGDIGCGGSWIEFDGF
jgi:hypothetical protein